MSYRALANISRVSHILLLNKYAKYEKLGNIRHNRNFAIGKTKF